MNELHETHETKLETFRHYLLSKGYRLITINGKINIVKTFTSWLEEKNISINQAGYNDLTDFMRSEQERGASRNAVNAKLTSIKQFFNYLMATEDRKDNPAAELRIRNQIRRVPHDLLSWEELEQLYKEYPDAGISGKRNKVLLSLLLWQGINTAEIAAIEVTDVKLEEGKIYIPATGRSNSRHLKLESFQILQLQKYITQIRPIILQISEKESEKLFISSGKSKRLDNSLTRVMRAVRKINPKARHPDQIRASILSHWLKNYNIRQVQYLAGHRYVSSTEYYRTDKLESLQEQLENLHPLK